MDQWFTLQQIKGRQAQASVTRNLYKCRTPGDLKYGSDFQVLPLNSACAAKNRPFSFIGIIHYIKENPPNFGNMWGWVIFRIF